MRDTQGLRMEHEPASMLPESFPAPKVVERWAQRGVAAWTRGYGEWGLSSPPEDFALQPVLDWSEEQRELVLTAYNETGGPATSRRARSTPSPGHPKATCGMPGTHTRASSSSAPNTVVQDDPDCEECRSLGRAPDTIEAAVWDWYVTAETWAPVGRQGSMSLEDSDRIEMSRRLGWTRVRSSTTRARAPSMTGEPVKNAPGATCCSWEDGPMQQRRGLSAPRYPVRLWHRRSQ